MEINRPDTDSYKTKVTISYRHNMITRACLGKPETKIFLLGVWPDHLTDPPGIWKWRSGLLNLVQLAGCDSTYTKHVRNDF